MPHTRPTPPAPPRRPRTPDEAQLVLPGFTGSYTRSLDADGRLALPPPFRQALGERAIITRGLEGHLVLTRPETWERWLAKGQGDPSWLGWQLSLTWEVQLRRLGGGGSRTILVPLSAREWAGLRPGQEATLAGCGEAVAIAAPDRWQETLDTWRAEQVARRRAAGGVGA